MALFKVDVDAHELTEVLEGFEKRGGDLSPTMAIIAEMLVSGVNDEFESEGQGNWDGFAEATLKSTPRRIGGKLLQDFGIFAGSINATSGPDFAEASTPVDYAVHHVYGAPKGNLPQRNPFDIEDRIFDEALDLILEQVVQ